MSAQNDVIAGKVVPISEAQLAQAVQVPLSAKVQQIITSSGVQALQVLTGSESDMTTVIKQYWNMK